MSWLMPFTTVLAVEFWDVTIKILAAASVILGPTLVVLLTRRGAKADRVSSERTEVEKLYIAGSQDLIKHLQGLLVSSTGDLAAARTKCKILQEEIDTANRSFSAFQEQYNRLVSFLKKSNVTLPDDL